MTRPQTSSGFGTQVAKGAAWVVGLRVAVRLLGLVSTVILARILSPADFGLLALSTLLVGSLEAFSAFNFHVWLVRHPDPSPDHYDTVWTLSVVRSLLIAVALVAIATPAGAFFEEPRLTGVVIAVALATAAGGFANVGVVDFQKHLRFDRDFLLLFGSRISSFAVTITLGFLLRSYWALVAGVATQKLAELLLSYLLHPYRPGICWRHTREIYAFTKWLLVGNVFALVYQRADTFLLGRLVSTQMLGLYTVAHEIASLAASELVTPIRRVLLPAYSRINKDPDALANGFLTGFAIILLCGLPLAAGIGLLADPIVRILLGQQWLGSIPLIEVLTVYGMTTVVMANQGPVLIALGRARLMTGMYIIGVAMLVPSFWWATSRFGVVGGAWAVALTNTVLVVITLRKTLQVLSITVRRLLQSAWRSLVATALMTAAINALTQLDLLVASPVLLGIVGTFCGAVVYAATALVLWRGSGRPPGAEQVVIDALRRLTGASRFL